MTHSPEPPRRVTDAEMEVLRGAAMGLDTVGITRLTGIAVGTVKSRLKRLMTKFNATNRTQLVVNAVREGVVTLNGEDPPHPAQVRWTVEVRGPDGTWRVARRDAPPFKERDVAHGFCEELAGRTPAFTYRVVRLTTTFDVDGET